MFYNVSKKVFACVRDAATAHTDVMTDHSLTPLEHNAIATDTLIRTETITKMVIGFILVQQRNVAQVGLS